MSDAMVFMVLIIVLIRPTGLLGKKFMKKYRGYYEKTIGKYLIKHISRTISYLV